jgi:hypothetical protein
MPVIYDYFRTAQKGKKCDVEVVKNPNGSNPAMWRILYVNKSFPSCHNKNEIITDINSDGDEKWSMKWNGGKIPKLSQYSRNELNNIPNSGIKLFYEFKKNYKILPECIYLFVDELFINFEKFVEINLSFGRLQLKKVKCRKENNETKSSDSDSCSSSDSFEHEKESLENIVYYSDKGIYDCNKKVFKWNISTKSKCISSNYLSIDICFPTSDLCTYVPEFKLKFKEFNTDFLYEWNPTDYNKINEFPCETSFVDKGFFYNSKLAIDGDLYKTSHQSEDYPPPYKESNTRVCFNTENSGIPGPYPFGWDWERWGGDEKYNIGPHFYAGILFNNCGPLNIATIQAKIAARKRCPTTQTKSQDLTLEHVINGSVEIFKRFTQLVDADGNNLEYDSTIPSGALKSLFGKLITGRGVSKCVIDINEIIGTLQLFKDTFASSSDNLKSIIDQLSEFLTDTLKEDIKIELLPWAKIIKEHQIGLYESFELYKLYYSLEQSDNDYYKVKDKTNHHIGKMIDGGRQFAALLGIFYSVVSFFDVFLSELGDISDPAIPDIYRNTRVKYIHQQLSRYFYEHVTLSDDYLKASAMNREDDMYKSNIGLSESNAFLAIQFGEIFRGMDKLIRDRELFGKLPESFP